MKCYYDVYRESLASNWKPVFVKTFDSRIDAYDFLYELEQKDNENKEYSFSYIKEVRVTRIF